MEDFNNYFLSSGIVRMDPTGQNQKKIDGVYTVLDDGDQDPIIFQDAELAPPSGFFGANYTWYF
jgi:hypothetical protein